MHRLVGQELGVLMLKVAQLENLAELQQTEHGMVQSPVLTVGLPETLC